MKKTLSIILALAMMLSVFAGCGSTPAEPTSKPTDSGSKAETPAEAPAETPKEEVVLKDPIQPEGLGSGTVKWSEALNKSGFMLVENKDGATLSYSPDSGVKLIQVDGFAFKDLNKNGKLDQYEDWRESAEARTQKLAAELTVEEIAGLFLHSNHVYDVNQISEDHKASLDGGLRAFLNASANAAPEVSAKWNNDLQAYAESTGVPIPVTISSDPRETGVSSLWPKDIGIAATFDPAIANKAGQIMSIEHRLMGINEFLRPLASIITDPRHYRYEATYGEDPLLTADMNNAILSGVQSTYDESGKDLGWGPDSMTGMAKRWPGNGSPEGGRNGHSTSGWLDVFPGGGEEAQLVPYADGVFQLDSETGAAAAVMISYSNFVGVDPEQVGGAFSKYVCDTLLRERFEFEGVACSDWGILGGRGHGIEELTVPERIYKSILAGLDQFGGWNTSAEIMEAYTMLVKDFGQETIDARFRETAVRVLRNKFLVGIYEDPYVDLDEAKTVVNSDEFKAEAFDAQLKSIVMLKNEGNVIKAAAGTEKPTVYVPMAYKPAAPGRWDSKIVPASYELPYGKEVLDEYFTVVTDKVSPTLTGPAGEDGKPTVAATDIIRASAAELATVDYSLAIAAGPVNAGSYNDGFGYVMDPKEYIPISLQYGPYTADSEFVRKESLSGATEMVEKEGPYGVEKVKQKENRSYYGKAAVITNPQQLDHILYAAENTPSDKPIITILTVDKPMIVSEFESKVDAILVSFTADPRAVLDIVTGKFEPSALLPSQWPVDMIAVEKQLEDLPRDMDCYKDASGNVYDFAFGLNWSGVIKDERVAKYNVPAQMEPINKGNVK